LAVCSAAWAALQVGLGLAGGVVALVQVALGDGVVLPQALGALALAAGVVHPGLGGQHLGMGAVHLGLVGRGVDGEQRVAGLDQRALAEVAGDNRARDAGAQLHMVTASRRPEKAVQGATSCWTTAATETGTPAAAAGVPSAPAWWDTSRAAAPAPARR
jgi:hypothetical protein